MWTEILNWLLKLFSKPPAPLRPVIRKEVSFAYVFGILNGLFPDASHIYLSDNLYWLCSEDDIKKFLEMDATNKEKYKTEKFDCDDFAYRLMGQLSTPEWAGIAFGIVWSEKHAACCFIDDKGTFFFIEPQSDELYKTLPDYMGKEILFILM